MKKMRDKISRLKLSFKKEMTRFFLIFFIIFSVGLTVSFFLKSYLYIAISLAFCTVFSYLYFQRYEKAISIINQKNIEEFVQLFIFFKIYIHNGYNVYNALQEITNFANQDLKELLNQLIKEIDNDKTVTPFVNFSKNFNEILIEEMMISIYQIIDDGQESSYLNQFEIIFDKFSDLINDKNLKTKDSNLGLLSSAPLIGSCFLIILITIGIIGVLGDLMNVI